MKAFRFKVALDFGDAYHFRFIDHLEDDPYGIVVDRCARIAKYAVSGTVICTADYRDSVKLRTAYVSMGIFPLKGISEPQEIFVRTFDSGDSLSFLTPIVSAVNSGSSTLDGYRSVGRQIDANFVKKLGEGNARPFIARELLNIPKLPYSHRELKKVLDECGTRDVEKYVGYFVELEAPFISYKLDGHELLLTFGKDAALSFYTSIEALLPTTNLEVVKTFKGGTKFLIRGVIVGIFLSIRINYVDLMMMTD